VKHADIETGRAYMLRVTIPGTPKVTLRKRVSVVATADRQVVVEHPAPVCVNRDDFPPEQHSRAMLDGKFRWEQRPTRRVVRAADIIAPADGDGPDGTGGGS
jgi:hypothetical protein